MSINEYNGFKPPAWVKNLTNILPPQQARIQVLPTL
jgi:hypothetical protein